MKNFFYKGIDLNGKEISGYLLAEDKFIAENIINNKGIIIEKIVNEDNSITIQNDGNGITIKKHEKEKIYIPQLIFGELLTSSNYKKDEWCDTVDGLYWRFVEKNINFFKSNPRLAVMTRSLEKMNKERKKNIFKKAEIFIKENTL